MFFGSYVLQVNNGRDLLQKDYPSENRLSSSNVSEVWLRECYVMQSSENARLTLVTSTRARRPAAVYDPRQFQFGVKLNF